MRACLRLGVMLSGAAASLQVLSRCCRQCHSFVKKNGTLSLVGVQSRVGLAVSAWRSVSHIPSSGVMSSGDGAAVARCPLLCLCHLIRNSSSECRVVGGNPPGGAAPDGVIFDIATNLLSRALLECCCWQVRCVGLDAVLESLVRKSWHCPKDVKIRAPAMSVHGCGPPSTPPTKGPGPALRSRTRRTSKRPCSTRTVPASRSIGGSRLPRTGRRDAAIQPRTLV